MAVGYGYLERAYWERTYKEYRRRYDIDATFRFHGYYTELLGDSPITLGARSYISARSMLVAYAAPIVIGSDCRISRQVRVESSAPNRAGEVRIGNGVLLGWNAYVAPGVTIGDGALIGANAVVFRDVPAGGVLKSRMILPE
jgi:acetyltransferase-like isoleucine patch superfamily enzyme